MEKKNFFHPLLLMRSSRATDTRIRFLEFSCFKKNARYNISKTLFWTNILIQIVFFWEKRKMLFWICFRYMPCVTNIRKLEILSLFVFTKKSLNKNYVKSFYSYSNCFVLSSCFSFEMDFLPFGCLIFTNWECLFVK